VTVIKKKEKEIWIEKVEKTEEGLKVKIWAGNIFFTFQLINKKVQVVSTGADAQVLDYNKKAPDYLFRRALKQAAAILKSREKIEKAKSLQLSFFNFS